jgi:hypothetical protein
MQYQEPTPSANSVFNTVPSVQSDAIIAMLHCHAACIKTMQHCLNQGGRYSEASQIARLEDCSEFCQVAANFTLRNAMHQAYVCGLCANICDACSRYLEYLDSDALIRTCIEACNRCALECRRLARGP